MAHDPISLLFSGTSDINEIIDVPRVTGSVQGSEITERNGYIPYKGEMTFTGQIVNIKLSYLYERGESSEIRPSQWNGKYKLEGCTGL